MTERIERIIITVLIGFLIILCIWLYFNYRELQQDRIEISGYEAQIEQLQYESEKLQQRFEESKQRARMDMQRIQNSQQKILAERDPKDCNKAITWGLHEARNFH